MIYKLEEKFIGTGEVKGFIFRQLVETKNAYLYEIEREDSKKHFEVIKRLTAPLCLDLKNRVYSETESKEYYPKSNRFGVDAWSFKSLDKASIKLSEL